MKSISVQKIKRPEDNHRVQQPTQTGFSSPATHYHEPRIDLNAVLVPNTDATFYIRMGDDSYEDLGIHQNDVLIVDKSLDPKTNQLVVVILDGNFQIIKIHPKIAEELNIWGVVTYIIKSLT